MKISLTRQTTSGSQASRRRIFPSKLDDGHLTNEFIDPGSLPLLSARVSRPNAQFRPTTAARCKKATNIPRSTINLPASRDLAPVQLIASRSGPLDRWRGGPKGMSTPAAYTPLESLFLFQSLLAHGVDTSAFARISEALRTNALIKAGETYDPARLAPEALEQLFLFLLREEIKSEAEKADAVAAGVAGRDGSASPSSKKRKLGSPPLPTLKDAYQHITKVPVLVDRLYARYRDHIVRLIREDERKFETVQKEIQLLERSEKERLARSASQSGTPVLAPRDPKTGAVSSNSPSPSPVPGAAGLRRPPPGVASQRPGSGASSPVTGGPGQLPSGTPPIRPSPSPKPPNGAQTPAAALPSAQQPPRQTSSPRPEQAIRPKDVSGPLKWEKPLLAPHPDAKQQTPAAAAAALAQQEGQPVQPPQATAGKPISTAPNTTPFAAGHPISAQGTPAIPDHTLPQSTPPAPGRPIQPSPANVPRPIASAPPPAGTSPAPKLTPAQAAAAAGQQHISLSTGQPTGPTAVDKQAYANQPRLAIPEHMRHAASTATPSKRTSSGSLPQTPNQASPMPLTRGFGTKWASQSTPSTPGPILEEPESPAFEPVSPPQRAGSIARGSSRSVSVKETPKKGDAKGRSRPSRSSQRGRAVSTTPSAAGTRRSQSVTSQTDELSIDYHTAPKVKKEVSTPRFQEETGDTTADESVHGRHTTTPGSVSSRIHKRKRQETPPQPPAKPTHVLWTRGFTKVSSSALDQISSHRDANMFATALRERDAPNYSQIVLQPQDITSIRAAIKHGNKAATQAAANLPDGDPGTASVWLPMSEDLMPPRSIINSAQLERELVHMFCNAIMYNPDPDRGPGPAFMKRSTDEEEEVVGYLVDEDGVVRNTRGMFIEVEKLLSDLRSAEKEREPPPPTTRHTSVAVGTPAPADDTAEEEDELAGDGDTIASSAAKRRRISTRT